MHHCDLANEKQSHVCVLVEGHYHYGLGALANSLASNNFSGTIWVGYRGALPYWLNALEPVAEIENCWQVSPGVQMRFLLIESSIPLVNYKPDFMLKLFSKFNLSHLFLMDADIIVKKDWGFFSEWIEHGVALFEDFLSPRSPHHLSRAKWKKIHESDFPEVRTLDIYVNSGFVGIKREYIALIENWKKFQELATFNIQGLEQSIVMAKSRSEYRKRSPHHLLYFDQDSLNAVLTTVHAPVSVLDRFAMGLFCDGEVLCHGLDSPKPWELSAFLRVTGLWRLVQWTKLAHFYSYYKVYFQHVSSPIPLYRRHPTACILKMHSKVAAVSDVSDMSEVEA